MKIFGITFFGHQTATQHDCLMLKEFIFIEEFERWIPVNVFFMSIKFFGSSLLMKLWHCSVRCGIPEGFWSTILKIY